METRTFDIHGEDSAFYEALAGWWRAHGWTPVLAAVLPRCGVMVEDDAGPMAAAFLHGKLWGWRGLDGVDGDAPGFAGATGLLAITMLTQAVREVALALDYGVVMTTARQGSLVRVLERNGFAVTDRNVTHLVMMTKS